MPLTIGKLIDGETKRGTLTHVSTDIGKPNLGDEVYHHEWARTDDPLGHLCCVMWAGIGRLYVHNLGTKALDVFHSPKLSDLGLRWLDTD